MLWCNTSFADFNGLAGVKEFQLSVRISEGDSCGVTKYKLENSLRYILSNSKIKLVEENILIINFEEKFTTERGRINCSLNDKNGWRWLGIQYVISEY